MPGLSPIKILGNLKFFASGLKLPRSKGLGDAKGWSEKYFRDRDPEAGEMSGAPTVIPPWFMPQKPGYKPTRRAATTVARGSRTSTTR